MKAYLLSVAAAGLLLSSCDSGNNAASTTTEKGGNMATTSDSSAAMAADSNRMGNAGMADTSRMAGTTAMADPNGPTAPHGSDAEFMQSAAHSDQNEMQLSKLALSKNVSAPIQAFANKMIADHTKSTANLKPIAQKAGVTLPTDMDAEHKALATSMEKLSGKDFEQKYVQQMVVDHQKTANTLKAYQPMAKAPGLTGWIDQTLPVVLQHLSMAKQDNRMAM